MVTPRIEEDFPPFWIQAGCPATLPELDPEAMDLSFAAEKAFPRMTESLVIFWHGGPIVWSYRYDVSDMLESIILLVTEVSASAAGECTISWGSSGFFACWKADWKAGQIRVAHEWIGDPPVNRQGHDTFLDRPIAMRVEAFLAEWRRPLEIVREALSSAGYTSSHLEQLPFLDEAIAKTGRRGCLYRRLEADDGLPPRAS